MDLVVRSGEWEATVSGDLEAQIRQALGESSRVVLAAVEREIYTIHRNADEAWPVRTLRSRNSLSRRVVIDASGAIRGEVRAGASYARFIQSWQIANRRGGDSPGTVEHLRALGAKQPVTRREIAQRAAAVLRKTNSRASRSGSAMWLLLRWPQKVAADKLTGELGPVIEAALAAKLEGP